nr:hypothetical protein [Brevundimonas diminuta]
MSKTFHDLVDATYRGQHLVVRRDQGFARGLPLRTNPEAFEHLIAHPSYHFGTLLAAYSDWINSFEHVEPPVDEAVRLMTQLGLDRAAIVLDSEVYGGETSIIMVENTTGGFLGVSAASFGNDDRHGRETCGKWIVFDDIGWNPKVTGPMIWLVAAAFEMLARPEVEYIVRQPSNGMSALRSARDKRGDPSIPDMQTIHLKKRIYIGGVAIGGGTHASPEPHDRSGHWRHSEREIPGWEEVQPTTGEYAGMTVWRKWIKDTPIKGGKPKNAAPQFRVVR